jgi:hypothetical protein
MQRRTLLRRGLLGGALLALGGGVSLGFYPSNLTAVPRGRTRVFDAKTFGIMAAVAARMVPLPGADPVTLAHGVDEALSYASPEVQAEIKQLLGLLESGLSGLMDGRFTSFSGASPASQDRTLAAWCDSRIALRRSGYQALRKLSVAAHYVSPSSWASVGYGGPPEILGRGG